MSMSDSAANQDSYTELRATLDELERVQPAGDAALESTADPRDRFCQIWRTARGVIELILRLPFVPGGAKAVLRTLLAAGDAICG
jgi:hypothetical protein